MDFIDKYLTLTANIKGTLQGTTSFLNSIPANMEDLKAVSDANHELVRRIRNERLSRR